MLQQLEQATTSGKKNEIQKSLITNIRGLHYDLVCDGIELGGGSIRNHSSQLQKSIFINALGMSHNDCDQKFGHLLDALSYGAPPHGGFALGFDRFIALLTKSVSIADTLAFPKSSVGTDPLTGAPSSLSIEEESEVLNRLGLQKKSD